MSESVPPNAAPDDAAERAETPATVEAAPAPPAEVAPAPAADVPPPEKDVPIWAQALSIAVIVSAASWWLLSERPQERVTESSPAAPKARPAPASAPAGEPEPAQIPPGAEDAPSKTRGPAAAQPSEPEVERPEGEPAPE